MGNKSAKAINGIKYNTWYNMVRRCKPTETDPNWARYRRLGISVHPPWVASFRCFAEEVAASIGQRPTAKHQLDRIDNDGNYEPGNLRWATPSENMRNSTCTRQLTYQGRTLCVVAWAAECGIRHRTIISRLNRGESVASALTRPVGQWRTKKEIQHDRED